MHVCKTLHGKRTSNQLKVSRLASTWSSILNAIKCREMWLHGCNTGRTEALTQAWFNSQMHSWNKNVMHWLTFTKYTIPKKRVSVCLCAIEKRLSANYTFQKNVHEKLKKRKKAYERTRRKEENKKHAEWMKQKRASKKLPSKNKAYREGERARVACSVPSYSTVCSIYLFIFLTFVTSCALWREWVYYMMVCRAFLHVFLLSSSLLLALSLSLFHHFAS